MVVGSVMKSVIDWELTPQLFEEQLDLMIEQASFFGKVLPLPIPISNANTSQLILGLLSRVDCSGCDSACCKAGSEEIAMLPEEYEDLKAKYPEVMKDIILEKDHVSVPCPLLKDGRCQVYPDRPMVCLVFPIQFGAVIGGPSGTDLENAFALSSLCPAAKRLTREIYLYRYQMRRRLKRLKIIH